MTADGSTSASRAARRSFAGPTRPRHPSAILVLATALTVMLAAVRPAPAEISRSQEIKARAFNTLSEGIEAYRKGDVKRSIDLLSQVTGVALNSFRAFYYLGLAYKADRQYTKAIERITFALELDPGNLQAHVDLGDSYLKRGDTEEALAEYHRALAIQQGYAPAWDGLGRSAEATGDDDKAVENFGKAIELNPGFPDASLNLGDLYLRRDRLREAVDLFVKAIGVRPDFAAAHNRLGVAYARQRLGNEAIAALRKAAELERGNPWHAYTIGLIEMDFGNLSQAVRDFDQALALDRNYLEAYVAKARLLRRLGDFESAGRLLDEALTRPSEDEKLKRDIAGMRDSFASEGREYRDLSSKVDSGAATSAETRSLADLRAAMGDFAGAAAALGRMAPGGGGSGGEGADPASLPDLFRLGYYLLRAGDYEAAERAFSSLRSARPGSVAVLTNLSLSLQGQGKNAAAEEALLEAIRIAPSDVTTLIALGNARIMEGRWEDAAGMFERVLSAADEFPARARVETLLKLLRGRRAAAPAPAGGGR